MYCSKEAYIFTVDFQKMALSSISNQKMLFKNSTMISANIKVPAVRLNNRPAGGIYFNAEGSDVQWMK